jgi:hypothetical protein
MFALPAFPDGNLIKHILLRMNRFIISLLNKIKKDFTFHRVDLSIGRIIFREKSGKPAENDTESFFRP